MLKQQHCVLNVPVMFDVIWWLYECCLSNKLEFY